MGIFKDPDGAEFCIWQGNTHHGIPPISENYLVHGFPCWFELNARNAEVCRNFYCNVFGYEYFTKKYDENIEYTVFLKEDEQVCGMIQMSPEWRNADPHWMVYFQVDDIEQTCNMGEKQLGGSVCIPPTALVGMKDRIAMLSDPCGLSFSVMSQIQIDKKEWILDNINLRSEISTLNMKLTRYQNKIKKLKEILNTIDDDEEQSKKIIKKKINQHQYKR